MNLDSQTPSPIQKERDKWQLATDLGGMLSGLAGIIALFITAPASYKTYVVIAGITVFSLGPVLLFAGPRQKQNLSFSLVLIVAFGVYFVFTHVPRDFTLQSRLEMKVNVLDDEFGDAIPAPPDLTNKIQVYTLDEADQPSLVRFSDNTIDINLSQVKTVKVNICGLRTKYDIEQMKAFALSDLHYSVTLILSHRLLRKITCR